ncbi:hypothetical protein OS493_019767 [Desmophyllum pertusum]|uniref:Uncharacterized protein n=1 Tax=Desmophyllum pertusum TaxID=174260 RepID=A0A9W9Z279_9CNID|nr:hypothetical protein OS493_019767 [Desmophyllum pertusum]
MDLWPRLRKVKQDEAKELWSLIELCLCCPYGNAVLMQREGDQIKGRGKQYLPRNGGQKRTRAMERAEFLEEWLADIGGDTESGSDIDVRDEDEELEEVDTTLDVDELASLSEEQTTERESHSEAEEWSDDPLDCGMRSDSPSDTDIE